MHYCQHTEIIKIKSAAATHKKEKETRNRSRESHRISKKMAAPHPLGHEDLKSDVQEGDRLISDSSGIFSESPGSFNGPADSRSKEVSPDLVKESTENVYEIYVHTTDIRGREQFHVEDFKKPVFNYLDMDTTNITPEESLKGIIDYVGLV